ncbi:MAG: hypothetical protein HZA51_11675 [Planctomycetes bacterium]|nr:hypothetical protein [Planctomycetota bacterium]
MNSDPRQLDALLATMGEAHRDGVFAARPACYPWKSAAARRADRQERRFGWVRVAIPLAAAAAVAVAFVAPGLTNKGRVQPIAGNLNVNLPSESANQMADAEKSPTSAATFDCDYNGDGTIDGRDIQAFVERLNEMHGDPGRQAEYLQRCLLGS